MRVCVFGAGSLGTLIGGLLASEHDVTLVGRDPHVATMQENGLEITGAVERQVTPTARTTPPDATDLAIVTVKSFDTPIAGQALADCSLEYALSLQNGMGNESVLANHLDCRVLAGTCTYGARLDGPGVVECTGIGDILVGARDGGDSEAGQTVSRAFDQAGLVVEHSTQMPRHLWAKLAVNAGINATTALARIPNGAILDGPTESIALEAAREAARVAREQGVKLSSKEAVERTKEVADATADNTASMQQDILAEKRTEIDAINGHVVDQAKTAVPINETLTALIRGWEQQRGLRLRSS